MGVPQISVFVENKKGRIAQVIGILGDAGFSIRGFSVADVSDYGIVRLLVDRGTEARRLLEEAGFTTVSTEVVSVLLDDRPGALGAVLRVLAEAGFDAEYMYLTAQSSVVVKVDEIEEVERVLREKGFSVLGAESID
ncbi:MAG: ACT domain-containing protein [Thermoleophilia bacterium]